MAKRFEEIYDYHPDAYRIKCSVCNNLFEAENSDFCYIGGYRLAYRCPWCDAVLTMKIRDLLKSKKHYERSIKYLD